ncbi:hypothetical protein ElyMa_006281500 [Elysia marginata]|uniref:Apextrin C-terminal domain-containing protein n=1 Tax=Elysia marginata TaxID=1093978 RepID=A0AAV4HC92_9GAST|nr:hypothetical protein ElyMa_006281500 [Elysia marginata]
MSPEPLDMPRGLPFYVQRETQICGRSDNQTIDDDGAFDHSFCPYTARVKYHKGYNGGHHRGFKLAYTLADKDDYVGYGCDNRSIYKTRTLVAIISINAEDHYDTRKESILTDNHYDCREESDKESKVTPNAELEKTEGVNSIRAETASSNCASVYQLYFGRKKERS